MHSEFYTPAQEEFILVSLDFPRGEEAKAAVPNPDRNRELMNQYGVRGFPTVIIASAEGVAYGQTGYRDMDPADYLVDVQRIRDTGKEALKSIRSLEAEMESSKDKLAVCLRAAEMLKEMEAGAPGMSVLADMVRKGMELTDSKETMVDLLKALFAAGAVTESELKKVDELDPDNANGLMLEAVSYKLDNLQSEEDLAGFVILAEKLHATGNVESGQASMYIYVSCAFFSQQYLNDAEGAKKWALRAQELGGLDERAQQVVDNILKDDTEE